MQLKGLQRGFFPFGRTTKPFHKLGRQRKAGTNRSCRESELHAPAGMPRSHDRLTCFFSSFHSMNITEITYHLATSPLTLYIHQIDTHCQPKVIVSQSEGKGGYSGVKSRSLRSASTAEQAVEVTLGQAIGALGINSRERHGSFATATVRGRAMSECGDLLARFETWQNVPLHYAKLFGWAFAARQNDETQTTNSCSGCWASRVHEKIRRGAGYGKSLGAIV